MGNLIYKWLKSENASSKETKMLATKTRKALDLSSREYRKLLTEGRKRCDVVERKMSAKQWPEINYEAVPSRANLIYNSAFLRNDEERRRKYLADLENGDAKINASVLYPHDIVHQYCTTSGWNRSIKATDTTLESLWKALPDTVNGCGNTMVVADGSGSMCSTVGNTKVTALEVANALAIYFAEHCSGDFKNQYITFSERPQFVQFNDGATLHDKLHTALAHDECSNTNVEAVFDLILDTAIKHKMSQDDMPQNILIISDMEFDSCAVTNNKQKSGYGWYSFSCHPDEKLFNVIKHQYANAGYKLPRLVFWNVNSRTCTIPVKENDLGVALVSGFSINIAKMIMSGKLDPFECLLETISSERYDPIENALK